MGDTNDLLRIALLVVGLVLVVPLLLMGVLLPTMGLWWASGGMGPGMMAGSGLQWALAMLLPLSLLALLGYGLYRLLTNDADGGADAALEELRLAYARGDLTDDEYETRHERLSE